MKRFKLRRSNLRKSQEKPDVIKSANNRNLQTKVIDQIGRLYEQMVRRKLSVFLLGLIAVTSLALVSCKSEEVTYRNIVATLGGLWDFDDSSDYTYDSNQIEIVNGKAQLKVVDTQHSGSDFNSGTHVGTYLDSSGIITLRKIPGSSDTLVNNILPGKSSKLLAYWRMDGNFFDSSGNNHHLTATNGASASGPSNTEGFSATFDGFDDKTDMPLTLSLPVNSKITVSFWNYVATGDVQASYVFSIGSQSNPNRALAHVPWSDGFLYWDYGDSGANGRISTNYAPYLDKWTHVTLVSEGNGGAFKAIYINGQLITSAASSDGPDINLSGGTVGYNNIRFHKGMIDDLAIWTDRLSATEIQTLYENQVTTYTELHSSWTPKYSNIVGYWKMDGNWQDSSSGTSHNGTNDGASFSSSSQVGSQSANFDGVANSLQVSNHTDFNIGANGISVSAWIFPESVSGAQTVVNKGFDATKDGFQFRLFGSGLQFAVGDGSTWYRPSGGTLVANRWYFVTGTYDGNDVKLYIDGVLVSSVAFAGPAVSSNRPIKIGEYQTDTQNAFDGLIDDVAIWNIGIEASDVVQIYNRQKQKYFGHYDSPIIDLGASGSWTTLTPTSELPFFKEVVASAESSSEYSALSGDLSDGLVGYWPLNGSYTDGSAAGNDGSVIGDPKFSLSCVMKGCTSFLSSPTEDSIDVGNSVFSTTNGLQPYSAFAWMKIIDTSAAIIGQYGSSANSGRFGLLLNSGRLTYFKGGSFLATSTAIINDGKWHHVGFVKQANGDITLYVDGRSDGTGSDTLIYENATVEFGRLAPGNYAIDFGSLDDIAIWSRALSSTEIQQLYRRGSNRIKYQVKSCVDSSCNCKAFNTAPVGSANDCDGDGTPNSSDTSDTFMAEWLGKDGATGETFSELQNCSTLDGSGDCSGTVNSSSPSFSFSDFPAAAQPSDNRYFQYRVLMEAEDNTACSGQPCMPELTSLEIGPTGRYFSGSPSIINKTSHPIDKAIERIEVTDGLGCNVGYQISNDGTNFYYWNGSAWVVGSDSSQSNDLVTLNANVSSFTDQIGFGNFYFRSYLGNSNFNGCELDKIQVIKNRR